MPAELTITVTTFTENASNTPPPTAAGCCEIRRDMGMNGDLIGAWKRDPDGQVFLCPDPDLGTIAVKRKAGSVAPVVLNFTIASGPGVPGLTPTIILFQEVDFRLGGPRTKIDPQGSKNFPNQSVSNGVLTVEDHWVNHGPSKDRNNHQAPIWKFWIRVKTAGGKLGWIDPTIENSEDMTAD